MAGQLAQGAVGVRERPHKRGVKVEFRRQGVRNERAVARLPLALPGKNARRLWYMRVH